jgi:hypothetical protein
MSLKPRLQILAALFTFAFSLTAHAALAGNAPQVEARNAGLDQLDCRTLLRIGGDERSYTLLYMHGFVSGKTGQLRLDVQTMSEVTDRVIDHCIDNPSDKLLPVFEKYRSTQ